MIEINLLRDLRHGGTAAPGRARRSFADFGGGGNEQYWFFGGILAGLLVLGALWWWNHGVVGRLETSVAQAQARADELAPILKEVAEFNAAKAEIVHKITVIDSLRANQRGPVQILDEVSRALPELLWLSRMEAKGNRVTMTGEAYNTNAVAAFLENLDGVSNFQEPVLKATQQRGGLYTFELSFQYSPVVSGAAVEEDTASGDGEVAAAR